MWARAVSCHPCGRSPGVRDNSSISSRAGERRRAYQALAPPLGCIPLHPFLPPTSCSRPSSMIHAALWLLQEPPSNIARAIMSMGSVVTRSHFRRPLEGGLAGDGARCSRVKGQRREEIPFQAARATETWGGGRLVETAPAATRLLARPGVPLAISNAARNGRLPAVAAAARPLRAAARAWRACGPAPGRPPRQSGQAQDNTLSPWPTSRHPRA